MDASFLIIPIVALGASVLTLISGFGLGTLLLPAFAIFFPLEIAILLTAAVHLLNNLFKLGIMGSDVHWPTVLRFGVPSIAGAFLGAMLIRSLGDQGMLFQGISNPVDRLDLVVATLMLLFGLLEISRKFNTLALPAKWLLPGGLVSGFFGGLSGHQGALRSIFLLRSGLPKEAYIATGVAIACLVDVTRIPAYLTGDTFDTLRARWPLLVTCTVAAFIGAWWGRQLIPKVTITSIQILVGLLLVAIAGMLGSGII